MSEEKRVTHFIVLDHAISIPGGGFTRGDVLHRDAFGETFDRFVGLGSIREATEDEARLSHVSVPFEQAKDPSYEARLEEMTRRVSELVGTNRTQATRISELLQENANAAAARDTANRLLQQAQGEITRLRGQVASLNEEAKRQIQQRLEQPAPVAQTSDTDNSNAGNGNANNGTGSQPVTAEATDEVETPDHIPVPPLGTGVEVSGGGHGDGTGVNEPLPANFPARADLVGFYGETVTPEELNVVSDEELDGIPNIGLATVKLIRDAIAKMTQGGAQ
jgi:hypothetical protein